MGIFASGALSRRITRFPSDMFLWAAGGSILASLLLMRKKNRKEHAIFVGEWVPTLVLLGLYRKMARLVRG